MRVSDSGARFGRTDIARTAEGGGRKRRARFAELADLDLSGADLRRIAALSDGYFVCFEGGSSQIQGRDDGLLVRCDGDRQLRYGADRIPVGFVDAVVGRVGRADRLLPAVCRVHLLDHEEARTRNGGCVNNRPSSVVRSVCKAADLRVGRFSLGPKAADCVRYRLFVRPIIT